MKLKEFFSKQREEKLTDIEKMEIYEQFLIKREKKSFLYRLNFYSKVVVATIIFIFIFYIIYPGFFNFEQNNDSKKISIKQISTGLYVNLKENKIETNQVYAREIGKILNIKGDVFLLFSGNKINITDKLVLDDVIYLSNNSSIQFLVDSGIYIKLIGPAKFKIEEIGFIDGKKIYGLNLLDGNYIKVKSEVKSNLIVKVDDIEIDNKVSDKVDYEFKLNKNKKIILNKGSNLIVKKKVNKKEVIKIVPSNKKVEIIEYMKKNKQIVSKLTDEKKVSNNDFKIFKDESKIENIDLDIKFVPDSNQLYTLSSLVYSSFLKKTINDLVIYYLAGDKNKFNIVSDNLRNKLVNIYKKFDLEIGSDVINRKIKLNRSLNINELLFLVDHLIDKLNKNYYIPATYMKGLKKLQGWLYIISNIKNKEKFKQVKDLSDFLDKLNISKKYKKILLDF